MNLVQALIDAVPFLLIWTGVAFVWALLRGSRMSLISFFFVSTGTFLCILFLIGFLRDGMGPDAVSTKGLEMVRRIGIAAAIPAGFWLLLNAVAFACYRLRFKSAA